MITNYGTMDLVIDDTTGRAKMVRGGVGGNTLIPGRDKAAEAIRRTPSSGVRAKAGSNPAPSPYRSKLEAAWANYLDTLKAVKEIEGWAYEPVRFKLPGQRNYYKIDFSSWIGRNVTFYEVKGWNKSDERSLVKMKTAAGLNRWGDFRIVKGINGVWDETPILP